MRAVLDWAQQKTLHRNRTIIRWQTAAREGVGEGIKRHALAQAAVASANGSEVREASRANI